MDYAMLQLDEEQADKIVLYLQGELEQSRAELGEKLRKYDKWKRQADGDPEYEVKNFPWMGASNIEIPVTGIMHNAVMGFFKKTLGNLKPFWNCKNYRIDQEWPEKAKTITDYINIIAESPLDLNLKPALRTLQKEFSLLGTSVARVCWNNDRTKVRKSVDGIPTEVDFVRHEGVKIELIPMEDIHYRIGYTSIQDSPWFSYTIHLPWHVIKNREAQGIYSNVDQVEMYYTTRLSEGRQNAEVRDNGNPAETLIYNIEIAYVKWDVDNDGTYEDIIITFEPESGVILAIDYNSLGMRPFVRFVYDEKPFMFTGKGVGQKCERLQDMITSIMNLTMDNAKFSSMRMLAVSNTGKERGNEKVYPAKIWVVEDASRDIRPIQAGEVYSSGYQNVNMLYNFAQQITSMNDIMHGASSQTMKSADGVQSQMLRMQQSTGMVDAITDSIIDSFSEMGLIIFMILVQHRDDVIEMEKKRRRLTEEQIDLLDRCLNIKLEEVPISVGFFIKTTRVDETFEARRQNYLMITQLLQMFWKEMLPIYAQISNPQVQLPDDLKMFMSKIYTSSSRLMENIVGDLTNEDPQKFLPDYKRMEFLYEMVQTMKNTQFEQFKQQVKGGNNGGPGLQRGPVMGGIPAGAEAYPGEEGARDQESTGEMSSFEGV